MAVTPPLSSPISTRFAGAASSRSLPSPCTASPLRSREPTSSFAIFCSSAVNPSSDGPLSKESTLDSSNGASISSNASSAIDFLTLCHRLKTTKRKGWLNHGIKSPESIGDHMYRMSLMALIASDIPPNIDRERCIKIAIVHDIAEAIVGDITPSDCVPKEEKSRREKEALDEMCQILGGGARADEIKELWAEYENNSSIEASIVKDFDKVEMILQALEYETEHEKILDEFFLSTAGKFQTDIGKKLAAEVVKRRNNRLKKRF